MTTSPAFSPAFAKEAFNVEALPQVWVEELPSESLWTPDEALPVQGWPAEGAPSALWRVQIDNSLRRITENNRLRLTEQGVYRIVRRGRRDPWNRDTPPSTVWSVSNA